MKKILILPIFLLLHLSLFADNTDKKSTTCEIITESELIVERTEKGASVEILKGEGVVFKINDPLIGEIYFEINTNRRFFNFNNSNLDRLDIVAIDAKGQKLPVSGQASGFKLIEGFWKLELSLEIDGKSLELSRRIKVNNYSL